jgi:hypothetical protein
MENNIKKNKHPNTHLIGNKYWLGRHHSEETKEKLRKINLGRHPTPETIEKLRISHLGKCNPNCYTKEANLKRVKTRIKNGTYNFSEEWKKNISLGHKGIKPKWKNPEERAKKISISKIGSHITEEIKEKVRKANIGKHHTLETRKKMSEIRKGENSYLWKGGITEFNKQVRMLFEYELWRESIFKRDNYTCQMCNNKGGELHAHHKKQLYELLHENNIKTIEEAKNCKELWDINNGITLCKKCHMEKHPNIKLHTHKKHNGQIKIIDPALR